jgi:transcriptional antiterminator RfaH
MNADDIRHILFERNWYAVYTRSRNEKKVLKLLTEAHVETFLPLHKTVRQWSDRKKLVELPLFSSYVFVKINQRECHKVLTVDGVVKFVSFEGAPAPIPLYQIENLKILISSNHSFEKSALQFEPGQKVVVNQGSLKGIVGELIRIGRKNRFLIRIEHMFQNLLVNLPAHQLEQISPK